VLRRVVATSFLLAALTGLWLLGFSAVATASQPNVLLIMTDDQRLDGTMAVMPKTRHWFGSYGTAFPEGYVTTPLCCPGRAGFYSGRYAHNNGVYHNSSVGNLDSNATLQRYLHDAGYLTGLVGKFFNEWNLWLAPPFFDRYSMIGGFEANYYPTVNDQGTIKSLAEPTPYYVTHFVKDRAVDFITRSESDDRRPWFLVVTPTAPHMPATPEPKYVDAPVPDQDRHESYYEADLTDKPDWLRQMRTLPENVEAIRKNQLRSLMSVDDMVDRIFTELVRRGEEQNTLAFFVSDNGFLWGEHTMRQKGQPYTEAIKVPFFGRWPSHRSLLPRGAIDDRIVANIDVAPTVMEATGTALPPDAPPMDGVSLLDRSSRRDRLLTEFYALGARSKVIPPWASIRTPAYHYIEYYQEDGVTPLAWSDGTPVREYYDLLNDPYEVTNLLHDGDPSNDPNTSAIAIKLQRERLCSGSNCHPSSGAPALRDDTPPRVQLDSPPAGVEATGPVRMSATASDNLGVAGVQFMLDGVPVGAEDTSSPYEIDADTSTVPEGAHALTAVARDAQGNVTVTPEAQVTIDNSAPRPIDVQTCVPSTTCGPSIGRAENGDAITYYFDDEMGPESFIAGWDGSPKLVRVDLNADDPAFGYHDTVTVADVPALGTIDLARGDYVGWYVGNSFGSSTIEMPPDRTTITITLGGGLPGLAPSLSDTMTWTPGPGAVNSAGTPLCVCFVTESGTRDRDF
jgi:arylsulfatase A-like enzyme